MNSLNLLLGGQHMDSKRSMETGQGLDYPFTILDLVHTSKRRDRREDNGLEREWARKAQYALRATVSDLRRQAQDTCLPLHLMEKFAHAIAQPCLKDGVRIIDNLHQMLECKGIHEVFVPDLARPNGSVNLIHVTFRSGIAPIFDAALHKALKLDSITLPPNTRPKRLSGTTHLPRFQLDCRRPERDLQLGMEQPLSTTE
jgi:hypothetical protein